VAKKIPAPHKVERIPFTVCSEQLVQAIGDLPTDTLIDARNRVLLWTLAETGCLVSEVTEIKFEHWSRNGASQAMVQIPGKSERLIPVSSELFFAIQQLKEKCASGKAIPSWIFLGFNKYGSLGAPISARGVELLVKLYSKKLGFSDLTPRIFRHSVILRWFEEGVSPKEIQSWLGLKTTYAFRSYEPLLIKSNSGTTSNAEKSSRES
jgi:site-specific recombinase XerD